MNLRFLIKNGGVALIMAFLPALTASADTPAFTSGGYTTTAPPSFTGTKGWSFYNYSPSGAIMITQLGVFDSNNDGLINSHQIGLWSVGGTLLASATVPAGSLAPVVDGYRYVPIVPVTIPRGNSYDPATAFIVAAQYSDGDADDFVTPMPVSGSYAPGIATWMGTGFSLGWYGFGSNLPFPNNRTGATGEGTIGSAFWEPSFQFVGVPEPSVLLLLAPGLLYLFLRRRKHPAGETS